MLEKEVRLKCWRFPLRLMLWVVACVFSLPLQAQMHAQQMQEQIAFATGAISNAMTEVKEIMTSLTQTSEKSGQEMITKLAAASEQMSTFLNGVMANVSESVQSSMKSITLPCEFFEADTVALLTTIVSVA